MFRRLLQDQRGATAIEYGLIATLIAVAAITSMVGLGNGVSGQMETVETKYVAANDG